MSEISLKVEGMHCANCASGVKRVLENQGFEKVNVNYVTGDISFQAEEYSFPRLAKEIHALGYELEGGSSEHHEHHHGHHNTTERRFYISLIFTVPLFLHMFLPIALLQNPFVQLGLALPVLYISTVYFGTSAWKSLRIGVPNMDVLIYVGSTAAFIYSLIGTYLFYGTHEIHNYLFYETSATIVTLVLLGNLLEQRSVKQTTSIVDELKKVQLIKAKKYIKDLLGERIIEVNYHDIHVGDILLVNSGDTVPVDGHVDWGTAALDEAMITGESLPVYKKSGDHVIGGTILVEGSLRIKTERVGNDTLLSDILKMVKNAQSTKPNIQKIGDKVSAIFVPVVILIAAFTFLAGWMLFDLSIQKALMNSIAVLVISCPCAMGLATPTAVVVGIGRAAKNGILIKKGTTLENLASTNFVVFDKTGTLTTGDFKIDKIEYFHEDKEYVDNLIFILEQHSSHPLAKSLVKELKKTNISNIEFAEINEEKGVGVTAKDAQRNIYKIGSWSMVSNLTKDNTRSVYLSKNDKLLASIDISDEIKTGAADVVQELKRMHLRPIILSGDVESKCKLLAEKVGIEEYYFQKLPSQKLEIIKDLKKKGNVLMIGDGINDAPAIAQATTGVSMGNSTNIAMNTAEVILLNGNDLELLVKTIKIGKHTLLTIKQNLFWAFFYNVVAIPLAAVGYLNPMVAALSMAFSDVVVIGNSIRFKFKKIF
jgi:P-type Cu+ transporter